MAKREHIPAKLRHEVFKRDNYRCRECGATNKETTLEIDHIVPVSKGGTNDINNLQTLCKRCNRSKYTRTWVGGADNDYNLNTTFNELQELNQKQRQINDAIYHRKKYGGKYTHDELRRINKKQRQINTVKYNNKHHNYNHTTKTELYELNRKQREINLSKHYAKHNHSNANHRDDVNNNSNQYSYLKTKKCPKCGTVLNRKARKCIKCGINIKIKQDYYTNNNSNHINLSKNKYYETNLNDDCTRIIDEFKVCNDINVVSKNVNIPAVQIKRWYRQGKRGNVDYEDFYHILSSLNPKMDIKEFDLDSLSTLDQLRYVASSFKKNKDINLVSNQTGVSENQIKLWFKLGKRGQWPYKIFYDNVSKFM